MKGSMKHSFQTLKTLIEFPSITGDYDANHNALEFIDRFLSERGMHVKRFEFNGVESLVATTQRTTTPTVMLTGHIDVVPADPEHFKFQQRDGKLIGRGMVDMKSAVAAYLDVVDTLQDELHDYDFGLMIVTDEEVGGFNGTVPLLEAGYLPKMCVLPDGGRDWALETFAKGLWLVDFEIDGKSAHGSRPWEGDSALTHMLRLTNEVTQLFPEQQGWNTSTCTLSRLNAGDAMNQVPGKATATFDFRYASVEDEKNLMNAVKLLFKSYNARIVDQVYSAPCVNDPENPYLKSFAASIEKYVGYPTGTTISNAGSDARFLTAKGVPCAIFYPSGGGHHGPEEWIPEEAYTQLQNIFLDYLRKEARLSQGEPTAAEHQLQI
jgi:succinyl-diaminopimelate desuccinylase